MLKLLGKKNAVEETEEMSKKWAYSRRRRLIRRLKFLKRPTSSKKDAEAD